MALTYIDVTGIDPWKLLAALHNRARPQGMGFINCVEGDITPEQAKDEARGTVTRESRFLPFYPDYLFGRPIKAFLVNKENRTYLNRIDLYDRDTGEGACAEVISKLKRAGE